MESPRCLIVNPFDLFYAQYYGLVFAIALRVVRDSAEAEDIAQNIFLRIWSRPGLFRGGNAAAWLATLAKNAAIDRLRSKARERAHAEREPAPRVDDIEDLAIARIERTWILRALATLPPAQRALIAQIYFGGRSHRQIARETSIPLGTVKTRIRSGLSHLRRAAADGAMTA